MRIGEPAYFQEFGPAGYHVTIGFANPKIINDRGSVLCDATGADCAHEVKGHVTTARMSRTPDERLYGSGTHDSYAFTQCYISLGDPDGADFAVHQVRCGRQLRFPEGSGRQLEDHDLRPMERPGCGRNYDGGRNVRPAIVPVSPTR